MPEPIRHRARRIVLHIGLEKTGTTTIQAFCARNREALRRRGVIYPAGFGPNNHVGLAAAFGELSYVRHIGPTEGWRGADDQGRFRTEVLDRLAALSRSAAGRTLLLSSEHLSSRLHAEPVATLQRMLAPLADRIDVVVFLRRQDDLLLSLYSTYVKSGGIRDRDWLGNVSWLDFDACLHRWEDTFGQAHVTVRRYAPTGGSLVADFFAAAGLPMIENATMPPRLNRSLDDRNMMLLKAINHRVAAWDSNGYVPQRAELVSLLEQRSAGAAPSMSLAERRAYLARFAESNERVRARHFARDTQLFAEPVEAEARGEGAGFEDAIDLAVELWRGRETPARSPADRLISAGARRWRALHRRARAVRLRVGGA